jgi:hypothetical protein
VAIWYIFSHLVCLDQEKSGNPCACRKNVLFARNATFFSSVTENGRICSDSEYSKNWKLAQHWPNHFAIDLCYKKGVVKVNFKAMVKVSRNNTSLMNDYSITVFDKKNYLK